MDIHLSILLFAIAAAFTPGPNNLMIMASGLNYGVRASIPHFYGICFGFPTLFLVIGFGLGAIFESYPLLHKIIKLIGVLYLIWLSWLIAKSTPVSNHKKITKPLSFIQAGLFQWVNPKAWIMSTSAIATYTTSGIDIGPQIMQIALVFFILTFPSAGTWLFLGGALKRIISNPSQQRIFNIIMASLLLLSVLPVGFELIIEAFA